jgi:hypothetical protein
VLYTSSNRYPNSINGAITINQGTGNDFTFMTDSNGGYIGWTQNRGVLSLAASSVVTSGEFFNYWIVEFRKRAYSR